MKEMNASQSLVKKNHPAESGHAILCSDGKYRWVYELDMLRNPSMFILVLKVFCIAMLIVFGFMIILDIYDGDSFQEILAFEGKLILIILAIMLAAQLIDNFVYQPVIYSTSIKSTPLEIFIVLLMAGRIGGTVGLLVGIPAYTVVRVIAIRFFSHKKAVRRLIPDIDKENTDALI